MIECTLRTILDCPIQENGEYDSPDILLEALMFGRKLADLIIETDSYAKR